MKTKKRSGQAKRRSAPKVKDMSARKGRSAKGGATVAQAAVAGAIAGAPGRPRIINPVKGDAEINFTQPKSR